MSTAAFAAVEALRRPLRPLPVERVTAWVDHCRAIDMGEPCPRSGDLPFIEPDLRVEVSAPADDLASFRVERVQLSAGHEVVRADDGRQHVVFRYGLLTADHPIGAGIIAWAKADLWRDERFASAAVDALRDEVATRRSVMRSAAE